MSAEGVRRILPFILAGMFFTLAWERPASRAAWLLIGVVFLVVAIRRGANRPKA